MADNWLDVKSAAALLGISTTYLRRLTQTHAAPHRRDGKRMYFEETTIKEWFAKFKSSKPARKAPKRRAKPKDDYDYFAPIDRSKLPVDKDWVMWNKGDWRGWAVGVVDSQTPTQTKLLVDYATKRLIWPTFEFGRDVASGKLFVVEPDQVIDFMIVQLLRLCGRDGKIEGPKEAIQHLHKANEALREWKTLREAELAGDE